jgi:dephospho-CoA kinase
MFIVGLTGGIGSGKSTVGKLFHNLGVLVLDADEIGKALIQPNSPLLSSVANHFGQTILNADGSLNRAALREIVFNNQEKRKQLESVMHPPILAEMQSRARHSNEPYCIFSIPLLFESGQNQYVDRVLVIDASVDLQRERVVKRNGLAPEQINAILDSQVSREYRLSHADDVIDNSMAMKQLEPQVQALHKKYTELSRTN